MIEASTERPILHQYTHDRFTCTLFKDGEFQVNGKKANWFKDTATGQPWLPVKFKSFKSLCKQAIREGDFE